MSVSICRHQFADNTRCQCVALKGRPYCRWHRTEEDRRRRTQRIETLPRTRPIRLEVMHDSKDVLSNINKLMNGVLDGSISARQAGVLLYGITTAMRA